MINIRLEEKTENRKTIDRIKKTKSFFEKIKKKCMLFVD